MSSTSSLPLSSTTTSDTPYFTSGAPTSAPDTSPAPQSSTLYLFTFLATLFVLLFVSSAIVLRSFFIRRRFRRRLEEAIAAGVLLPPTNGPASRRRDFGAKPILWDAYVEPCKDGSWQSIQPIAARIPPRPVHTRLPPLQTKAESSTSHRFPSFSDIFHARRRASSVSSIDTVPHDARPPQHDGIEDQLSQASQIQVSVLIMMPNPHKPSHSEGRDEMSVKGKKRSSGPQGCWDEEEEGVPDIVVGVGQIPYRNDSET